MTRESESIYFVQEDLSLLRHQLKSIAFPRPAPVTATRGHFATLTFAPPTTPPTSPQPKDLLRTHLKHRRGLFEKDAKCHVVFVDGLEVLDDTAMQPHDDDNYNYNEGLRKRKSMHLLPTDDDTDDDIADDTDDKTKHRRPHYGQE
ncbi:hypothetical protein ACHHYP_04165 [Achlya hypogyna]|uniref:Uncharacterized protein n=1 Tax=Achlya hypogyna TaxID=1202772 RepID=A0A1V9Z2D9_ACHHY|nr:hypothetical protein ACHHYP_04165 [Achlya hypogyna]